ncbi:MAG: tryptophan synthase, alpha subunit [Herbinix sp.]|jgi:tryptophan synthase alpha chain|nr:tryptophan synthase, alpha subunit [Herbinix sp.]
MNRIGKVFQNNKAFIPFITAGDPNLTITKELVLRMEVAGADLIELGIPFSDPVAEGPVIQAADDRALTNGVTTDKIFDMVEELRKESSIPLAFMTYINPIYTYGVQRFMERCERAGIDAIIVPDLPFEEKEEIKPYCDHYGVVLISMIAPTSMERIRMITKEAEGFLYCVSSMGVTGVRSDLGSGIAEMIAEARKSKDIPCAIGFGISTQEQAKEMSAFADGVIVGSAIVKIVGEYGEACVPYVEDYTRRMKEACQDDSQCE